MLLCVWPTQRWGLVYHQPCRNQMPTWLFHTVNMPTVLSSYPGWQLGVPQSLLHKTRRNEAVHQRNPMSLPDIPTKRGPPDCVHSVYHQIGRRPRKHVKVVVELNSVSIWILRISVLYMVFHKIRQDFYKDSEYITSTTTDWTVSRAHEGNLYSTD
jgi:hypothetical protein